MLPTLTEAIYSRLRLKKLSAAGLLVTSFFLIINAQAMTNNVTDVSVDFANPKEIQNWVIINDTVMGGRSAARIQIENSRLFFYGNLSLQNNGGFASTRRLGEPVNWSNQQNISLKLIGDGKQYQFRLRTGRTWDGVAYVASFKTNGILQTLNFSPSDFSPQWRGRSVTNAPDLNFTDVLQIGFMLADKQPGKFQIEVQSISQ